MGDFESRVRDRARGRKTFGESNCLEKISKNQAYLVSQRILMQGFDGLEFGIVGQNGCIQALGGGDAKGVGIGKRMLTFDFCCGSDQGLVHGEELDAAAVRGAEAPPSSWQDPPAA